jgi:hypothetical protein
MPDRRTRLPGGTRAASQRAVQKVFENEQALAELRGADRVRRRVREVLDSSTVTVPLGDVEVEMVPVVLVERALAQHAPPEE